MSLNESLKTWKPSQFTLGEKGSSTPCAVVILNQPLRNRDLFVGVCTRAKIVVCADGGANQLYELGLTGEEEAVCHPDAICGDMDSLRPEVKEHYRRTGTAIFEDPDQYSTDLTKALKYINSHVETRWGFDWTKASGSRTPPIPRPEVAIFGSLGGRADQAFSQLHQLYVQKERPFKMLGDLYLITQESIMFVLDKGQNLVTTPVGDGHLDRNVGIIPISRPSMITTQGLEYDVTSWHTEFGSQVSTSNYIISPVVYVDTTEWVLFTVGITQESEYQDSKKLLIDS